MKKREQIKQAFVHTLEIPSEIVYREPVLTMSGGHFLCIENYKNILCYSKEEILVRTSCGCLRIEGKQLHIPFYNAEEMQVEGRILSVSLEGR